jgi:hypothetical protein
MKPINMLVAATALVIAAPPAFAANWVYLTTNVSDTDLYYDADTIVRSGNQVTVWEKWDHSRDKTVKERERKRRYRYDCAQRTMTLLHSIIYYPDGKSTSFTWETYEQTADPIAPDTVGEAVLEAVCAATAP